ncbi:MAG: outer membrane protein transport protein [Rikenellaceae bacterium]
MKKIFLFALATACVATASAEGYQVNTLSAKQFGMAHTGVSQKLNSESVWFNPAAAAYQEQKFTVAAGFTGIKALADWESADRSESYSSDNGLSTPLYLNLNYKVNDDLAVGLSFNTPFGSSVNWGDSWQGAHLVQDISLSSYCAQPTVSYKLFNDKLSIGAGLTVSWGTFELSRSIFPVSATTNATLAYAASAGYTAAGMDDMAAAVSSAITSVGDAPLASVTLNGQAAVAVGVNVGLMYDFNEKWSVGFAYRSKTMMKVAEGDAEVDYANEVVQAAIYSTTQIMDEGTFEAELPLPANMNWGVTFRPTERWNISAEMQWIGWSAYDNLDVLFTEESLADYSINAEKSYKNTFAYRLGAEFAAKEWLDVRAGIYTDQSPVSSDHLNPETPSMDKIGYTFGFSVMPFECNRNLSLDVAYGYISPASKERYGSYTDTNKLTGAAEAFAGYYRAVAHTFSVGVSWGF